MCTVGYAPPFHPSVGRHFSVPSRTQGRVLSSDVPVRVLITETACAHDELDVILSYDPDALDILHLRFGQHPLSFGLECIDDVNEDEFHHGRRTLVVQMRPHAGGASTTAGEGGEQEGGESKQWVLAPPCDREFLHWFQLLRKKIYEVSRCTRQLRNMWAWAAWRRSDSDAACAVPTDGIRSFRRDSGNPTYGRMKNCTVRRMRSAARATQIGVQ